MRVTHMDEARVNPTTAWLSPGQRCDAVPQGAPMACVACFDNKEGWLLIFNCHPYVNTLTIKERSCASSLGLARLFPESDWTFGAKANQ